MSIVQILLFVVLVVFPFGQVGRISLQEGLVNIIFLDLAIFLTIVTYLFLNSSDKQWKGLLTKPLFLFWGVAFLSLLINVKNLSLNELVISLLYLLRFCFYTSLYFVIKKQDLSFKKRFTVGLFLSGFVVVLLGITQYFFYPDLRNLYYAGWDEHLYRVFSTFLDPNFAGAFFVLEILLLGSFIFHRFFLNQWQNYLLSLMMITTLFALFLTYSRSALAMFFVSAIMFFIVLKQTRLISFLIIVFVIGILLLPKNMPSEGVNLFRTASISARAEEAEHALTIIKDNFLLGVGFNAYRFAKREYGFLDEDSWREVHSGSGTDNSLLFVLATTGAVGLTAYLFLLSNIIKLGRKSFSSKDKFYKSLGVVLFCGTLGLIVNSFFINSLFYPHIIAWLFLLAGVIERE